MIGPIFLIALVASGCTTYEVGFDNLQYMGLLRRFIPIHRLTQGYIALQRCYSAPGRVPGILIDLDNLHR
jgi:hypothetical protein